MPPSTKKKRHASSTKKPKSRRATSVRTPKRRRTGKTPHKKTSDSHTLEHGFVRTIRWVALVAIVFLLGYCVGHCIYAPKPESKQRPNKSQTEHQPSPKPKPIPEPKATPHKPTPPAIHKQKPTTPPKEPKKLTPTPSVKKEITSKPKPPANELQVLKLAYRGVKPKLAIVIDDVHTKKQIEMIDDVGMPVTPSIFPPYTLAPHTPRLARGVVHYMVHLPMESGNAKYDSQSNTLKVTDSAATIQKRVAQLRHLFPRARFVNNHTGSRFTQNKRAMQRLYSALKKEHFAFIDSKTTPKSTVGAIAHSFGDDYVARDIFLDNTKEEGAIMRQLKKAVALAKRNGYAIAIGHPYRVTLQTLKKAKPLLKEVEVVYIEKLFRR